MLADAEALGERLALGDKLALGLKEALGELEAEGDLLWDADGLKEAEGDKLADAEGLMLALGDELAEALGEREALGLIDGDTEAEGERLAEGDKEAEGLREALGLRDALGAIVRPGASPYQFTPGRGPGCPSSYKKILLASCKVSLGRRDLSIRVITPRFQLERVRYSGCGNLIGGSASSRKGISKSLLSPAPLMA